MKGDGWLWLGIGAGVLLLTRRDDLQPLGSPLDGDLVVTPRGHFGAHRDGPPVHRHQGIDLRARSGSIVRAIGDGIIVATRPGLGKIVRKLKLDVPAAWETSGRRVGAVVYADLGQPLVSPGDRVRRGDPVTLVGKEGFVHFAVKELAMARETFFDPAEAGLSYSLSSPATKRAQVA